MADTKHHAGPAGIPVEGDGVNYRGIGWFVIILAATTVFCQVLVWGVFEWLDARAVANDTTRSAVSGPLVQPAIVDGRIAGSSNRPGPAMLVSEPTNLEAYRAKETAELDTYGWVDQNEGIVRIPIERAKELLLERGLPSR